MIFFEKDHSVSVWIYFIKKIEEGLASSAFGDFIIQHIITMRKFLILSSLWLAATALVTADDAVQIRAHWETGKVYTQEVVTEMNVMMPELAAAGGQKTEINQTMSITVKPDPGTDNKLAAVKVVSMKANMAVMGQSMTYDSADPAKSSPMLQQSFGALVGKEFTIVYDKNDMITGTRDLDKLLPTPVGGGKSPNGEQLADAFRKSQEMGLPKDPVAPGGTWTYENKIDMPPAGAIVIKGTGKYDSNITVDGRKHAKILMNGKFTTPDASEPGKPQRGLVKFGEGSTMAGEVAYDLERRLVTKSEVNSLIKMNIGGKEIPMTQKMTSKLISVEPIK